MNILDTIKPIILLKGPHKDTGVTGSGCIMNVAAYLNGDEFITDKSSCVHEIFHGLAAAVNDHLSNEDRQTLLPLVTKLMGSASADAGTVYRWRGIQLKLTMDTEGLFVAIDRRFPNLLQRILGGLEYSNPFLAYEYLALKERDMLEQHDLGKHSYIEFKAVQSQLHEYQRQVTALQEAALIAMFDLLPDQEPTAIVQGRATELATIAKARAAALA